MFHHRDIEAQSHRTVANTKTPTQEEFTNPALQIWVGEVGFDGSLITWWQQNSGNAFGFPLSSVVFSPTALKEMLRWVKNAMFFAMVLAFLAIFAVKLRCAMAS